MLIGQQKVRKKLCREMQAAEKHRNLFGKENGGRTKLLCMANVEKRRDFTLLFLCLPEERLTNPGKI